MVEHEFGDFVHWDGHKRIGAVRHGRRQITITEAPRIPGLKQPPLYVYWMPASYHGEIQENAASSRRSIEPPEHAWFARMVGRVFHEFDKLFAGSDKW